MKSFLSILAVVLSVGFIFGQKAEWPKQLGGTGPTGITTTMPNRPRDKQGRYLTGSGVALAQVNPKTGDLISIRMLESTGHKELDEFAIRQLRAWKFKRGTPSSVKVPISFH
jgi:TonB family protein